MPMRSGKTRRPGKKKAPVHIESTTTEFAKRKRRASRMPPISLPDLMRSIRRIHHS